MSYFGSKVAAWRIAKGLSQEELAQKSKISRPNLSAIEHDHRDLTLTTFSKLSRALGISPAQVLSESPALHLDPLDRYAVDAIARAVISGKRSLTPIHNQFSDALAGLVRSRLEAHHAPGFKRVRRRKTSSGEQKLLVDFLYGRELVERILKRVEKVMS